MFEPILYEMHMHTPLCRHARGEPEEYAAVAQQRGLKGIVVTCHNPIPDGFAQSSRMYPEQFELYLTLVDRARRALEGQVDVRVGLECDYFPGHEPWLQEQLKQAEFHHVLGSIHPHIEEYRKAYWTGNAVAFQETYFEHLAQAAETGLFDTISHPDLVKNISPREWRVERVMGVICKSLDRIAATGVAMELNTSGLNKSVQEMNPGPVMLAEMAKRKIPVVIGADAHVPERVADRYEEALDQLEAAGYREVNYFLERKRNTVSIQTVRDSLLRPVEIPAAKG